jgi:outer membrane protein OmpA-like peptidoglycan-associated protein
MSAASSGHHTAASFTDLMASLMVIFVLLFIAYVNNAAAKGKNVQDTLLAKLQEQLRVVGISQDAVRRDERDKNAIVVIMPDSVLFDKGKTDLKSGGVAALQGLMPLLAGVLCETDVRASIQTVVVEGHTDTTWASSGLGAQAEETARDLNLALSQGRSMQVVLTGLKALPDAGQRACFRNLLSASGRGQEEPLPGVPGDDARQRRVVFKIRVATDLATQLTGGMADGGAKVQEQATGR